MSLYSAAVQLLSVKSTLKMRGIFFVPEADLAAKGAREATGVLDEGVEGFAFAGPGRLVAKSEPTDGF